MHDYLEKAMAPHSSTLAWKIPWMEEPGRLLKQLSSSSSMHDYYTFFHHFYHMCNIHLFTSVILHLKFCFI